MAKKRRGPWMYAVKPLRGRLYVIIDSFDEYLWRVKLPCDVEVVSKRGYTTQSIALRQARRYCHEHGVELIEGDR